MLLKFEKRNEHTKIDEVFKTTHQKSKIRPCFDCKKTGHIKDQCWYNKDKPKKSFSHRNNNNQHHYDKTNKFKQRRDNKSFTANEFALSTTASISDVLEENIWYLGSVCTSHMTPNKSLVEEGLEQVKNISVPEDGRAITSTCVGNISLSTTIANFKLKDMLVVPKFRDNLLSLQVIFSSEEAKVISDKCEVICSGGFKSNFFSIKFNKPQNGEEDFCLKTDLNDILLWHKRLGHVNKRKLDNMVIKNVVVGLGPFMGV